MRPMLLVAVTDGQDFKDNQAMTGEQFKEAEQQAEQYTDGNWSWVILNAVPIPTNHYYVIDEYGSRVGLIWYSVGSRQWITQHQEAPNRVRQHTFDHLADVAMFCLEHPVYGTGTLTTLDQLNDLVSYIRALRIKKQLPFDLKALAQQEQRPPIPDVSDLNSLGQLAYAVWCINTDLEQPSHVNDRSTLVDQQHNLDEGLNEGHKREWESMTEAEQTAWMRVGEALFELGQRKILETLVKEIYAVTEMNSGT